MFLESLSFFVAQSFFMPIVLALVGIFCFLMALFLLRAATHLELTELELLEARLGGERSAIVETAVFDNADDTLRYLQRRNRHLP